jgi:hypothetical protein
MPLSRALFGLAFATAPPHGLTSDTPQTRRLILQKARSHDRDSQGITATLPRLVGTRFQVLFHSAPAVLFTIPSRYYTLSVTREYLGLPGGPGRFTQDSSGPVLLGWSSQRVANVSATGVLPSTPGLSHALRLRPRFLTRRPSGRTVRKTPTTPPTQPLPGSSTQTV